MRAPTPLSRVVGLAGALGLLLALPPPAFADAEDGRYASPDHALAAGDRAGRNLFEQQKHTVLPPRQDERRNPEVEPPRNELPQWPAKWAPPVEDDR